MTKQGNREGASMPVPLSTKLNRISETAKKNPEFQFRTLAHLINEEMLTKSYRELRRNAAAGVDGMTSREYEKSLEENIRGLHQRLRERRYRAQSLKRVYIEKEDGKRRPLSIPVLEDKIVQKSTVEILSRIYEEDFLPCSYGYRPGKNAHQLVQALQKEIVLGNVNHVLEADIQDYFGSIVREKLKEMLTKRIADKDIMRLIGKWLRVGVIEDGRLLMSEDGTYQGSVISPILANVYLHEVLDRWMEEEVNPRMRGAVKLLRWADDFVVCFRYQDDAERFLEVLPKRFERYGLKLHSEKTRLMSFGRFERENSQRQGRKPNTFNFLGFTFYGTKDRKGRFTVKSKTMSKRVRRSLKEVGQWCRINRHRRVQEQWCHLTAVLRGHYQYYGIRANYKCLQQFFWRIRRIWKKWLSRRSQKAYLSWEKYNRILKKYPLPTPWITQGSKPEQLELFQ